MITPPTSRLQQLYLRENKHNQPCNYSYYLESINQTPNTLLNQNSNTQHFKLVLNDTPSY
jgi:hypothetical protein